MFDKNRARASVSRAASQRGRASTGRVFYVDRGFHFIFGSRGRCLWRSDLEGTFDARFSSVWQQLDTTSFTRPAWRLLVFRAAISEACTELALGTAARRTVSGLIVGPYWRWKEMADMVGIMLCVCRLSPARRRSNIYHPTPRVAGPGRWCSTMETRQHIVAQGT